LYFGPLSISHVTLSGESATLLSANATAMVNLSGSNTNVRNLSFSTTHSGVAIAVLPGATGFEISNNRFTGFHQSITVQSASDGNITSNKITLVHENDSSGVDITSGHNINLKYNDMSLDVEDSRGRTECINLRSASDIVIFQDELKNATFGIDASRCTRVKCLDIHFLSLHIGVSADDSQNVEIDTNQFVTVDNVLAFNVDTNVDIHKNRFVGGRGTVLGIYGSSNVEVRNNILFPDRGSTGSLLRALGGSDLKVHDNQFYQSSLGMDIFEIKGGPPLNNVSIANNLIQHTMNAIRITGATGNVTVQSNHMLDCSAFDSLSDAVIFVNAGTASKISIVDNSYSGITDDLTYFIHSVQGPPVATVSGNSTRTMLPNLIGH
jgi:nitrous oxidase accessory protein NosD